MNRYKTIAKISIALIVAAGVAAVSSNGLWAKADGSGTAVWRFDCGPAKSPVEDGYKVLTAEDKYDASKGYGWEAGSPKSVVLDLPGAGPKGGRGGGGNWMADFAEENRTALTRDAVVSKEDLQFRVDVPDGVYRVTLTLGDFFQAVGSMDVEINGEIAEKRVAAWAPGVYRMLQKTPMGWWTEVRHTVAVKDGAIRIKMTADQSYYDAQMAEQMTWENPVGVHWRSDTTKKDPPYDYIGYPFVHFPVMGIEVVPDVPAPIVADGLKLQVSKGAKVSKAIATAIEQYNADEFPGVMMTLDGATDPADQAAKAIVQLYLAGNMSLEKEQTLVPAAIETLKPYVAAHPEENGVAEFLKDAEIFQQGMEIHLNRGKMLWVDGKPGQRNHFIENDKAFGMLWLIKEGSPLYYKAQMHCAIINHQLQPYIPSLAVTKQIMEELEKKFPDNRFVKYYLHWTWEPYGDGSGPTDWVLHDYYSETEGSPEWARYLQANYANMLDWSEWWHDFKQQPEGNIGGGMSDDVEIVGAFGYLGFISKGVSDKSVEATANLVNGMWNLTDIDTEAGYQDALADAEHSAEPTGNTLGMMVQIDFGNPVWIERAMKTGKLIRDLWTDFNDKGDRHFRANFLGSMNVGGGDQANDSFINYRAIRPAAAVLAYNQNPTISKLFVELADAWVNDAMATDRGKPKGVIPAQVSYPEGLLGGTNSPNWHTASHPAGTVNYDWSGGKGQNYKQYIQDLLTTAYLQTGEKKFLDPLKMEYEIADRYGRVPEVKGKERLGVAPWLKPMNDTRNGYDILLRRWTPPQRESDAAEAAAPVGGAPKELKKDDADLKEGSEAWVAKELKGTEAWLQAKKLLEGGSVELVNDITKQQIVDHLMFAVEHRKMSWPLMTTQASATDRIPIPGLLQVAFTYTGGGFGGPMLRMPITYVNTTKYFAAAVMSVNTRGFRILYHSMAPDSRTVGIVPWELEPSGKYLLRYGPDVNEDEKMDSVAEEREFVFPQAGTPIEIKVAPKTTYLVEVTQLERGRIAQMAPDPGLSSSDLSYAADSGFLLARIHNVGSKPVRDLDVAFYDGDPADGGTLLGKTVIPNIEAPNDLEPRTVRVGIRWSPKQESHDIHVVIDPDNRIADEITTFNNAAAAQLPRPEEKKDPKLIMRGF